MVLDKIYCSSVVKIGSLTGVIINIEGLMRRAAIRRTLRWLQSNSPPSIDKTYKKSAYQILTEVRRKKKTILGVTHLVAVNTGREKGSALK